MKPVRSRFGSGRENLSERGKGPTARNAVIVKTPSESRFAAAVALVAGVTFYFSTQTVYQLFDYTFQIAVALLHGHVGLPTKPPSWLNEFVPFEGGYYSVFPLGAVLANIPVALLQRIGMIQRWPAHQLAAALAAGCAYFFCRLSYVAELSNARRVVVALFPIFASWTWCNLGLGGAWQVALGFALLGQTASLYYTLVRRNPLLAGIWFAVALGNRTEVLLTAPIYLYYFWLSQPSNNRRGGHAKTNRDRQRIWIDLAQFVTVPALLLLCTAIYNWVRFGGVADFGYARIPHVLEESSYQHGLFSLSAIRWNAYEMLFRGMFDMPDFPYLRPHAFGCSIFLASPFLFLLFREGGKYKAACWTAIGILTLILWSHGNAGGWQFSYRYGMIFLPWMFLLIVENGGRNLAVAEAALFAVSVAINGMATYEFLWTNIIHP
jgi:hypothetical protein